MQSQSTKVNCISLYQQTEKEVISNHLFPIWPSKLQQYVTFSQVTTINSRQNTNTKKQKQNHKDLKVLESGQMQMIPKGS